MISYNFSLFITSLSLFSVQAFGQGMLQMHSAELRRIHYREVDRHDGIRVGELLAHYLWRSLCPERSFSVST